MEEAKEQDLQDREVIETITLQTGQVNLDAINTSTEVPTIAKTTEAVPVVMPPGDKSPDPLNLAPQPIDTFKGNQPDQMLEEKMPSTHMPDMNEVASTGQGESSVYAQVTQNDVADEAPKVAGSPDEYIPPQSTPHPTESLAEDLPPKQVDNSHDAVSSARPVPPVPSKIPVEPAPLTELSSNPVPQPLKPKSVQPSTVVTEEMVTGSVATAAIPVSTDIPDVGSIPAPVPAAASHYPPQSPTDSNEFQLKPIKWIEPHGVMRHYKIVTQNENGPCPLIALCNALILRHEIAITPYDRPTVNAEHLVSLLADHILSSPQSPPNVDALLSLLPSLSLGMDVNVRFQDIQAFESSHGVDLFHAMNVPLYHGWTIEEDDDRYPLLKDLSYNSAVELIVVGDELSRGTVVENENMSSAELEQAVEANRSMSEEDRAQVRDAMIVSHFLETTKMQLTYHGLMSLYDRMEQGQVSVLFRNNHFSTLFKRPSDSPMLFVLVTDAVFANEPNIAWESLGDIDQATSDFHDDEFRKSSTMGGDYVQRQQRQVEEPLPADNMAGGGDADLALAMELQQEEEHREQERRQREREQQQREDQQYRDQQQQYQQPPPLAPPAQRAAAPKKKKKDDCVIA